VRRVVVRHIDSHTRIAQEVFTRPGLAPDPSGSRSTSGGNTASHKLSKPTPPPEAEIGEGVTGIGATPSQPR